MPDTPFRIDREYDQENASDGVSRYGTYIQQATFKPDSGDGQAVDLAVFAWRQATPPIMAPGYVRYHQRIMGARLMRSDWDGSLLAHVDLVTSQPPNLRWLRSDGDLGMWRDWPVQRVLAGPDRFYEPDSDEIARSPYLLTSASLRFTVPSRPGRELPHPSEYPRLEYAADQAVTLIVAELNRIVAPVIDAIERG